MLRADREWCSLHPSAGHPQQTQEEGCGQGDDGQSDAGGRQERHQQRLHLRQGGQQGEARTRNNSTLPLGIRKNIQYNDNHKPIRQCLVCRRGYIWAGSSGSSPRGPARPTPACSPWRRSGTGRGMRRTSDHSDPSRSYVHIPLQINDIKNSLHNSRYICKKKHTGLLHNEIIQLRDRTIVFQDKNLDHETIWSLIDMISQKRTKTTPKIRHIV